MVLGIGDRHAQNVLVDVRTAEVVHIDFGVAFEQGESMERERGRWSGHVCSTFDTNPTPSPRPPMKGKLLNIPEVVPFRLTNDVVDGMGVSGVRGGFTKASEETLRVLRENAEAIVTICEVFLHDPLHRWVSSVGSSLSLTLTMGERPAQMDGRPAEKEDGGGRGRIRLERPRGSKRGWGDRHDHRGGGGGELGRGTGHPPVETQASGFRRGLR